MPFPPVEYGKGRRLQLEPLASPHSPGHKVSRGFRSGHDRVPPALSPSLLGHGHASSPIAFSSSPLLKRQSSLPLNAEQQAVMHHHAGAMHASLHHCGCGSGVSSPVHSLPHGPPHIVRAIDTSDAFPFDDEHEVFNPPSTSSRNGGRKRSSSLTACDTGTAPCCPPQREQFHSQGGNGVCSRGGTLPPAMARLGGSGGGQGTPSNLSPARPFTRSLSYGSEPILDPSRCSSSSSCSRQQFTQLRPLGPSCLQRMVFFPHDASPPFSSSPSHRAALSPSSLSLDPTSSLPPPAAACMAPPSAPSCPSPSDSGPNPFAHRSGPSPSYPEPAAGLSHSAPQVSNHNFYSHHQQHQHQQQQADAPPPAPSITTTSSLYARRGLLRRHSSASSSSSSLTLEELQTSYSITTPDEPNATPHDSSSGASTPSPQGPSPPQPFASFSASFFNASSSSGSTGFMSSGSSSLNPSRSIDRDRERAKRNDRLLQKRLQEASTGGNSPGAGPSMWGRKPSSSSSSSPFGAMAAQQSQAQPPAFEFPLWKGKKDNSQEDSASQGKGRVEGSVEVKGGEAATAGGVTSVVVVEEEEARSAAWGGGDGRHQPAKQSTEESGETRRRPKAHRSRSRSRTSDDMDQVDPEAETETEGCSPRSRRASKSSPPLAPTPTPDPPSQISKAPMPPQQPKRSQRPTFSPRWCQSQVRSGSSGSGLCRNSGNAVLETLPEEVAVEEGTIEWKKGEQIGKGTFGAVYMGLNAATGELFAVKQIFLVDGSEEEVKRLEGEIKLMRRLHHEHIVQYLGTARDSQSLFIFMEYVPGGSIASMLTQFGLFTEELIKRFVRQILLGTDYLHKQGIVHRDIKGANVLVTDSGIAKLADFGCSKQLHGIQSSSLEDSLRVITGSVPWMAPEVIKQSGRIPKAADIWSIGATVIEMATASHPWPQCTNQLATLFHVATSTSPPPLPPNLSPLAHDFLNRCMVVDETGRASTGELLTHPFICPSPNNAAASADSPTGKDKACPEPPTMECSQLHLGPSPRRTSFSPSSVPCPSSSSPAALRRALNPPPSPLPLGPGSCSPSLYRRSLDAPPSGPHSTGSTTRRLSHSPSSSPSLGSLSSSSSSSSSSTSSRGSSGGGAWAERPSAARLGQTLAMLRQHDSKAGARKASATSATNAARQPSASQHNTNSASPPQQQQQQRRE